MTWVYIFSAVAAVAALFGFGIFGAMAVARVVSIVFALLAAGAGVLHWRNRASQSGSRGPDT
ncbi:hypothetical protein [Jannaschia donghaensis]|uniref:Uncharacterized protein n=1 Tax=Jannaschia donghaensis TaxID=420998 RepID=A0A0M6YG77_9RHOB|nr:hypothetical protein [Jannaschia donghaensis]CTQ48086.1 hypothetical protein JDO7802_00087 [Jannaschia donghaensis]